MKTHPNRREILINAGSACGVTVPALLKPQTLSAFSPNSGRQQQAKSCIIIYLWGGIAHKESWDPKPDAKS
ncbi:MAG: hypothetical protein VX438_11155, partial [Planctomycetota bacterium]|nr:hypothetical protein [Planctomycetota bacterium]